MQNYRFFGIKIKIYFFFIKAYLLFIPDPEEREREWFLSPII